MEVSVRERKMIKEELGEKTLKEDEIEELKNRTNELKCDIKVKERLLKEIDRYENTPSISPEANVTRDYIISHSC